MAVRVGAREVLLDIAARRMGIDPIELRRRNLLRRTSCRTRTPTACPTTTSRPSRPSSRPWRCSTTTPSAAEQADARAAGRYLGVGTCTYVEPTTTGMAFYGTEGATIRIEPSGKVNVYVAGGSTGNSLETTVVQLTPTPSASTSPTSTPSRATPRSRRSAPAPAAAAADRCSPARWPRPPPVLRERIVAIAAHRLEASPDDIELAGSQGDRARHPAGISLAEIADIAYFKPTSLPPGAGRAGGQRPLHAGPMIWANATHVCTCEVDVVTGVVTLLRYIVSEDCGPMINPNVVEGQIAGGTVQGIGGVLYEHLGLRRRRQPARDDVHRLPAPHDREVPVIEYGHVETPGPGPGGYKGVGEGGAIGAPPTAVNSRGRPAVRGDRRGDDALQPLPHRRPGRPPRAHGADPAHAGLRANATLRHAEWPAVIARYAARRMGLPEDALAPQLVATCRSAPPTPPTSEWLRDESSDLTELVHRAFGLIESSRRW